VGDLSTRRNKVVGFQMLSPTLTPDEPPQGISLGFFVGEADRGQPRTITPFSWRNKRNGQEVVMPSGKHPLPTLEDHRVEELAGNLDREVAEAETLALAEEAEAEAVAAEARAAAALARARAIRLRREAEAAQRASSAGADATPSTHGGVVVDTDDAGVEDTEVEDTESDDGVYDEAPAAKPRRSPLRWLRRPRRKAVAVGVAIICTCALVAASGYMAWYHQQALHHQQRAAAFAAAARQGVVALFSIDHNKAKQDVQRILDNSTGQFRDDFQHDAEDFTRAAQEAKVVTEGTVQATAVESMTDDSAVVLVAATSTVTNAAGAKQDPRPWRLSVSVSRDGDQIKISKVEFVP
jgi:Mce-associated membrane protein